jgi:hypothetical protein
MLRDPSAFFNLMLVYDASQSAQADKMRLYINGVLAPSATTSGSSSITHTMSVSKSGMNQIIGNNSVNDAKANLLIADVYFLDGVAKTVTGGVTDFTELNGYGGLKPKEYTGTDFGNNGFHIDAQPAHDAELLVSSIDRNDGDTLFADAAKGHTITVSGNTHHDNTVGNPFGSGTAMYFDGTGDNLVVTSDSSFNEFGTGDFTIEMWVNPTDQGSGSFAQMFELWDSSSDRMYLRIERQSSQNVYKFVVSGSDSFDVESDSAPDYGNWQHLAVVRNGTSITMYVDGTAQTDSVTISSSASYSWPSRNLKIAKGNSAIGSSADYEGYIFDYRITKGTARYTSDFSSDLPSAPFELNPVYIGGDQSGNKNHFTPTNISSHDVMLDVPYPKNYATFNPLYSDSVDVLTEGNCQAAHTTGGSTYYTPTTVGFNTGKFYFEVYAVSASSSGTMVGVVNESATGYVGSDSNGVGYHDSNGTIYNNGNTGTSYDTFETGDIIGCAFDADTKKVWFAKNNSWNGSPTAGTGQAATLSGTLFAAVRAYTGTLHINTGADQTFAGEASSRSDSPDTSQSEFYYAPPTGFKSLNTSNLDAPAVTPSENFNTVLYTGDGNTNHDITGVGFEPALTWIKSRSSRWHQWYDAARGAGKVVHSNSPNPESDNTDYFGPFQSDGFRLAPTTSGTGENALDENYVAWNWKAHQGGSTSYSNTLTLDVRDNYGSGSGWGTTKLEVWEGSTKLTDITNPPSSSSKIYNIKTNDLDKIKIVWYVDGSAGDWYNMYAVLKNSSNTTLASWDGNSWSGNSSDAPSDDDNFYLPSSFDSTNAATTGVVEAADADTERYNSSAGFTIIKYAGAGSSDGDTKTLNHSLGVPLEFVIAKARTSNGYDNGDWIVWHKDLSSSKYLYLNSNSAQRTESSGYDLISTTNSGSQHQVVVNNGTDGSSFNYHYLNSGEDYILYGWAGVEGYSKFGSYTGTGSATSLPFIYTGFEVGWLLTKNIDNGSVHWNLHDSARNPHNVVDERVWANLPNASDSNYDKFDFYSNGFRPVTGDAGHNGNGNTIIYAAFSSSSPFKHANAR